MKYWADAQKINAPGNTYLTSMPDLVVMVLVIMMEGVMFAGI